MKKIICLAVFLNSCLIFSQSAEEIIGKYINAIGGYEKWNSVKGIKMEMNGEFGFMEIPIETVQFKDGKRYLKMFPQGREIKQIVSNGKVFWKTNPNTQKQELLDSETTTAIRATQDDFPNPFLNYVEKGYKVILIGEKNIDGKICIQLKLIKENFKLNNEDVVNEVVYSFDKETFLLVMTENKILNGPKKGQMGYSKFNDYKMVEGLKFPHTITEMGSVKKVKKITLNPEIDDKEFAFIW
jgi:outer membrane lipoprotein-sorting protein